VDPVSGLTTYQLGIEMTNEASSVYALFGHPNRTMQLPPAFQVDTPFGSHIGGVNPVFLDTTTDTTLQYDSYLTIGVMDGNVDDTLAHVGMPFELWTVDNGMTVTDGAIYHRDVALATEQWTLTRVTALGTGLLRAFHTAHAVRWFRRT
jgi:hypothetical protein